MIDTFHKHIRASLANQSLQSALDANAEKRISASMEAKSTLPEEWRVLRQRAHAIRLQTITNLDDYLNLFIENVKENGVIVHRADDATRAVRIVLDIAQEKRARLIAKSKTMVSEEIRLNHYLEAAGMQVVETDLGEYIIQLRGEPPAHIITPAIHLRKEDVGKTFQEKLGIPYTEDISTMTAVARRNLRRIFLEADIGISGVNFGVAETGTLCLVTNEGNGRMVTTLPPVHIALMGIERLVPSMDDLALMLSLLPRSATGQKLTVYTSLINSPRRLGEPDGPIERHLILVDNGRSAMSESPLAEALLCIRCGACLNACPVFGEIGGHAYVNNQGESSTYPGPIGSIVSPGLFGQAQFGQLARASSLCGACKEVCPVDIDLPKLLLRVRAGGSNLHSHTVEQKIPMHVSWGLKLYTWIATRTGWYNLALEFGGFISQIIAPRSSWLRLPKFTGWGYSKDFPRLARIPFRERWSNDLGELISQEEINQFAQEPQTEIGERVGAHSIDSGERIHRFTAELEALSGSITICKGENLSQLVFDFLEKEGITSLLTWDEGQFPDGLLESLRIKGVKISDQFDPQFKAGISGAIAAIAETGTLVLPAGPGRPQFVSLIPQVHLAVVNASDIHPYLSQVLQLPDVINASSVTLISGPSRTADIEMSLTIGVHGPRQVHVFCIEDQ
jgi:L-lactate dehydrogenase complex protein LldF